MLRAEATAAWVEATPASAGIRAWLGMLVGRLVALTSVLDSPRAPARVLDRGPGSSAAIVFATDDSASGIDASAASATRITATMPALIRTGGGIRIHPTMTSSAD